MDDGIQCRGEDVNIATRKPKGIQFCRIDAERIEAEIDHRTDVWSEIVANPPLDVPSLVQIPSGVANRLSETCTNLKRKRRYFLRGQRTPQEQTETRCQSKT